MTKKIVSTILGLLFFANSTFASCLGYDYSLSYFGYKMDAGGTYRLNICGSYSYNGTWTPTNWGVYNYPLLESIHDNLAGYCSTTNPYGATLDYTNNYVGKITKNSIDYKYRTPNYGAGNEVFGQYNNVQCAPIISIKCNGSSWTTVSAGFAPGDIQTCFGSALKSSDFVSVSYTGIFPPSNPLVYFDPQEYLNFQSTEIAPVLTYGSPASSATTTFSSSSAPFFFVGSVAYSSAVHAFDRMCLQYSTSSGLFNDTDMCCASINGQNAPFSITCTPNASSTYYFRYKLVGSSKGQFAEYVFPQASNPFILNGTPSSWAISQNPQFASTTAKVDCSSQVLITDIFLCEIKNVLIDTFVPSQDGMQAFKEQSQILIRKFPFNYISELKSLFDYLANYSYTAASPTFSVKGLPYTSSTAVKSVQPFNAIPTTTVSLLGNKTPIEGIRWMTKIAMLLIFVQVCYLTFARFVLNSPE